MLPAYVCIPYVCRVNVTALIFSGLRSASVTMVFDLGQVDSPGNQYARLPPWGSSIKLILRSGEHTRASKIGMRKAEIVGVIPTTVFRSKDLENAGRQNIRCTRYLEGCCPHLENNFRCRLQVWSKDTTAKNQVGRSVQSFNSSSVHICAVVDRR